MSLFTRLVCLAMLALLGLGGTASLWKHSPKRYVLAHFETPLTGRMLSQRYNAELGLTRLANVVVPPHSEFSFNKTVGSWSMDTGFRKAPVSYDGQLILSYGGGVCQTSTTLYNAALLAGMRIVERHAHAFAPKYVPPGRDAAVAFSNIDLRFTNPYDFPVTIHGYRMRDRLIVELTGPKPLADRPAITEHVDQVLRPVEFRLGSGEGRRRVRTSGETGYSVEVYRTDASGTELVSSDSYPAMNRVVEYR